MFFKLINHGLDYIENFSKKKNDSGFKFAIHDPLMEKKTLITHTYQNFKYHSE